ncbi:uncharacterized protein [Nicotiana tomentosiformis]
MSKGVQSWSGIGAARILAGRSGRHGCNQVLCSYFYTINRNWNTQLKNRMRLLMDGKFLRVLPPISISEPHIFVSPAFSCSIHILHRIVFLNLQMSNKRGNIGVKMSIFLKRAFAWSTRKWGCDDTSSTFFSGPINLHGDDQSCWLGNSIWFVLRVVI